MMGPFHGFEALTFDCYGTLIDWESGILKALRPVLTGVRTPDDESLLQLYASVESSIQAGPFMPYREVLLAVARSMASTLGAEPSPADAERFAASVGDWPPFPDSGESLRALASRYRLAIVSNVDDDLFAASARRLGVEFDEVVTAQQVRAYKPAPAHFHEVLRRLGLPRERVLHVAQSLFHDVGPAGELGFTTLWVNRRAGRGGSGATAPATASPDFEVPDMRSVVELLDGGSF